MAIGESQRTRVLVSAASRHGSTSEIARVIGAVLASNGIDVDIVPPDAVDSVADYDAVVLGSAVYGGHWLAPARDLVARFRAELAARGLWLFSSGPVGDPARKLVQSMRQDPAELAWIRRDTAPRDHRVFAGRLDPKLLSWPERAVLLLLRGMRGDFRDWTGIEQWASGIAAGLAGTPAGPLAGEEARGPSPRPGPAVS
jgi:menaquinone-dependent protoporphyrinogen oxidase